MTQTIQEVFGRALSTGERRAFYILNVIFEIETRRKNNQETFIIVDDIADSFDYQNKYAIIQYLKDISEDGLFKMVIMTHNFDFFRTVESRFVQYRFCLMASRASAGIVLEQASGIKNVFAKDWKGKFFVDDRKKIASIPFLRNLIEMTVGETAGDYSKLTAMLHWKKETSSITVAELDAIFNRLCKEDKKSPNQGELVCDLIIAEAAKCSANSGLGLANKIVLAIAVRLLSEKFMIGRIADPEFIESIEANQTASLISAFKKKFPDEGDTISTLGKVELMTPENIHVNSFMYEPIIDMSDDSLRRLHDQVKALV